MGNKHTGRLELTWTDKDKTLLSTGDGQYDYTFVQPSDYRVSEVRLLHEVERIEAPAPDDCPDGLPKPTDDNLLITGDAMHVLDVLAKVPDYAEKYLGKVRLVYIDPPFNTGQAFENYEDNIEHSVWLTMLRDRLKQIKPLLATNGSVWVHLDETEVHRCRAVMDEEFGAENFAGTVVWQKTYAPKSDQPRFSNEHDYLLVYSATPRWRSNRMDRLATSDDKYRTVDGDPRLWRNDNATAPSAHRNQTWVYAIQHPFTGELLYPPGGRCWAQNQDSIHASLEEWGVQYRREVIDDDEKRAAICSVQVSEIRKGVPALLLDVPVEEAERIASERYERGCWPKFYFTRGGKGGLSLKRYQDEVTVRGRAPHTIWTYSEVGHSDGAKKEIQALFPSETPFSTPKPERLLQRIIRIGSDPGDIVLDCYGGSGTTAAVAHKMGRRWVTSELLTANVETFTKPRLAKVVKGDDLGGITTAMERVAVKDLPDGVSPTDAQEFNRLLNKVFDPDKPIEIPLAKELSRIVRAAQKQGESPLDADQTRHLLKLLKAFAPDGAPFDVQKPVRVQLAKRTRTKDETTTHWLGGGGFTHLEVGPSMFEEVDGFVLLADWATRGDLAKAMCAQLEVRYRPDGIFAASRGKVRYVVIDGHVGGSTVRSVLDQLQEGHIVEVWATQYDDEAADLLRKQRPGSRLEAIPDSVLDRYRRKATMGSPFKKEKADE